MQTREHAPQNGEIFVGNELGTKELLNTGIQNPLPPPV
jgi:hypothetical protein